MKILFVTGTLSHGGAQRVIAEVSSQLVEFGHDVSVIVFRRYENEYPVDDRIRIFSLASSEDEYDRISSLKRAFMLRKIIRDIKPDVAVGFLEGGYGLFVSSLGMRFKKIASARVNPVYLLEEGGLRGFLNRLWFRHADAVVMQTESQIALLPRNCRWHRCTVIPNPASNTALSSHEHEYNRPVTRIVMAGRLDDQKDYPMAIEAMESVHTRFPEIRLDIYGEGEDHSALESKIRESGLDGVVNLKGWTQCILEEYGKSDLYVMSSKFEGMPNSLMEAMACGLVCISTDCETGPSELMSDGKNGYLIPVGDPVALSDKIIRIAEMSADERTEIGTNARKSISDRFSSEIIGKQWESLFDEVLRHQEN